MTRPSRLEARVVRSAQGGSARIPRRDRTSGRRALRGVTAAITSFAVLSIMSPIVVDRAFAVVTTGVSPTGRVYLPAATANQGLTVVDDGEHVLARGHASIPADLRAQGWVHIGDPDAAPGFVVDAYQGRPNAGSKAFEITYADGRRVLLVHRLVPGESYHNSFVTISPNRKWLVAGEWGEINRLLVFALPARARALSERTLRLAGVISLRQPVRDVQGCDFGSRSRLLCSTNDTTTALLPVTRQLVLLTLNHALQGRPVTAAVKLVASVPDQDLCTGTGGEVEGIDVTDGVVRVAVNSPCSRLTEVFVYPRNAAWRPAGDIDLHTSWSGAPPLLDVRIDLVDAPNRPIRAPCSTPPLHLRR